MKSTKLLLLFLLLFLFSCSKKDNLEDIFITSKDYYWQYNNSCYVEDVYSRINFKFGEDGYSHRYDFSVNEGYTLKEGGTSDIPVEPEKWHITKDSTLLWGGFKYKILHIDRTIIVLQYIDARDKKTECRIRLLKVVGEK